MMGDRFREFTLDFIHFKKVLCFNALRSTNLKLSEFITKHSNAPDVIIAGKQTTGKGRRNNYWFSPNGGLWMSVVLPNVISDKNLTTLNITCGLTCAKACNTVIKETGERNLRTFLRWPNDLIMQDKKLGGLLLEVKTVGNRTKSIVLGIGINVNQRSFPESLKDSAISLYMVLNRKVSRKSLFLEILKELDTMLKKIDEKEVNGLLEEWKGYSYEIGKNIEIEAENGVKKYGRVLGIGESGELFIIDRTDRITKIFNGYNLRILDR